MHMDCATRLLCATTQLEACIMQLQAMLPAQDKLYTPGASDDALARAENARLLTLLQAHPPPRPTMLPQRRLKLAAQQSWACALCGGLLSAAFHADHRVPWSESFDDGDANIAILCVPCHLEKTSRETSKHNKSTPDRRDHHKSTH